jgi:flagellar biosynthesis/type III secretory pathway protein FliH
MNRQISTVIKADDSNHKIRPIAFHFDDIADQARLELENYRAEADSIIEAARQEADTIRNQARIDGREEIRAEIEADLSRRQSEQLSTLMPSIQNAVKGLEEARQVWAAHWELLGVELAVGIAERIIRQEVADHPEISLGWIREALQLAVGSQKIQLRLHPDDRAALDNDIQTVIETIGILGEVEVVADSAIDLGGCRVDTPFGEIDQQIGLQLARIEEELTAA